MIRITLRYPFTLFQSIKNKSLIPLSISPYSTRRLPRSKRGKSKPQPLDPTLLDRAISSLPPRFSSSDLAETLVHESNPLLCFHLLSWYLHHPRFRPDPNPFLITIKKLGSSRLYTEFDSITSLSLSLPSFPVTSTLYNTIIYFYCEARKLGKAMHVYTRMRASPDPSVHPNAHTYNLLFTALLARGGPNSYIHYVYMDIVSALFRQMVDAHVEPDVMSLNALVKGYSQSLHLNDALRIFHQMGPVYKCEPDSCTYSYLIHGLSAQGRTRNAQELFDEMREKGLMLSAKAGNSLVSALAMEGEVAAAERVMWTVAGMGRAVDGITCRALLEEICRRGRKAEAVGLVRDMEEREVVDGRMSRELRSWIQEEFGEDDLVVSNGLRFEK
ncbi:pentatricopeptide repeat-containing protein At2g27800, mitochondrial-like [Typha latifolia]|uniref:pentatricopeptide repeat-containing protein At2g27800, mitochondrial-like n=1 Tax=Typha latifolia TaxID=4733 RepID=UPI003C2BDB4A